MKKAWDSKQLGEVSVINYGYTESASFEPIGPRFLRITDIQNDRVDWESVPYCNIVSMNIPKYRLATGDIVFARTGATTGKSFLVNNPPEAVFASYLIRLRLIDKKLLPEFLTLFFQTTGYWQSIKEGSTGSAQGGFNATKLAGLSIPVPPIREQKRIVAILDEAFEGIGAAVANAEKNLASARELFENYLNSVFTRKGKGWVEKKLSDVCSIASKLVDPRKPAFVDLPHLGAGNMISKTGELVDIKTAREEGLKSGKFLFDDKIVLYSKIRPYLMKACRPDFNGLCSADVYPLLPDETHLDRNFLFHMLMSPQFTNYAIAGSDRAGMPKVNRDHLFRYSVWLPGVDEQTRLASKLDAISAESGRLEAIYQQKLNNLAELKQAILQKAFAGELTAQPEKALQEAAE